ncbi:MAG TPA: carboxypeptidase regulatory-like domain-containing protein [Bryobacteraceae bacterium]|nr:carboxypeptidase regulatory-like domain-containing protein [Bryobacteraceae bacterium]
MLKVAVAALLLCGLLGAAEISGIIVEAGGARSSLANVTIKNQSTMVRRDLIADQDGTFRTTDLPPDSYIVTARSVRTGDSATATTNVNQGQHVDLQIRLSGGWQVDPPITHGQEGGNLEGYGPYGIRGNFSINAVGQRAQNNNFLLDGMDNNDAWLHGVALAPPAEIIESSDLVSPYIPAEFGRATGAVVNVQTRSGTNQLHGSVFDYFQNSALNARNFFDGADKPAATRNQFGASLSGPIRKDDWFFFIDAEGLRERQGLTVISTVPTPAQKSGDFGSTAIYNPFSISPDYVRLPFANNRIPASMIPAAARNLVALYPDPNLPGVADNFRFTRALINNGSDFGAHSDKTLTSRSSLSARFDYQHRNQQSPGALPGFAGSDFRQHADDAQTWLTAWSGGVSHTYVLSATLLNQFRIGANQIRTNGEPNNPGLPTVAPEGFVQLGANNAVPFRIRTTSYQLEDSVQWRRGRHAFEAGFSVIRRNATGSASEWTSRGNFLFTPDYTSQQGVAQTGDSIASLLLGFPTEVRKDVQLADYRLRAWELAGFIQDELRIGRRLTIQAGIRYSLDPPLTEAGNRMVNFHFETHGAESIEFAGQNGVNGYASVSFYRRAIAPRIGFTLDVFGTDATILRGGFSKAYDPGSYLTTGALARNPPYGSRLDLINGTFQLGPNLADGLPAVDASNQAVYAIGPGNYEPYADQWGLTIEQRLRAKLTLEIAGLSSMGAHLYERYDANQPYPAPTPYAYARYPFEPYHGRVDYLDLAGGSTYYGGQLKLSGQPLPGLQFTTTYLYAKSIDDSTAPGTEQDSRPPGPQYIYSLRSVRSVSPFDIPQRLMLAASYELPFHVRVGTLITIQSGLPFTPQLAVNSLNNGGFQLPNRVGSGALPAGQQSYLQWFNTGLNVPGSAFELPPLYQYGNSGYDILRGPGLANADVSLARDFALRDALHLESAHLRMRLEVLNLLNRTNFALPERILGVESSGVISHTATASRQVQLVVKLDW